MGRRAAAFLLVLCLAVSATGCGKGGQTGQDAEGLSAAGLQGTDNGPMWQYKAEELKVGTDADVSADVTLFGEALYYPVIEQDEEAESRSSYIQKYSLADGSVTKLLLKNEGGYPLEMDICEDGSVYAVVSYREAGREESFRKLEKYGPDGSRSYCGEIEELVSGNWMLHFVTDGEGRGYLTRDAQILLFDAEGNFAGSIDTLNGSGDGSGRVNAICRGKDGKIYACVTDRNRKASLMEVDFAKREAKIVMDEFACCAEGGLSVSAEKDLLAHDGSMVYEYDLTEGTRRTLFSWTDSGVNGNQITALWAFSDEKFLAVQKADAKKSGCVLLLSRLSEDERPQKEELVIAALSASMTLKEMVVDFNKNSDKYHITLKNYLGEGEITTESVEDAHTRMLLDVFSDNPPDLLMQQFYAEDMEHLTEQEALEDLAPWLDKSTVLSRDDFVDNVLEGCMVGDALIKLPKEFGLHAVLGQTSVVGEDEGLSLEKLMDLAAEHPKTQIFSYADESYLLSTCLKFGMDAFVDWDAGTCSFDSPEFIRLLEFADKSGKVESSSDATYEEKYRRGEILLYTCVLQQFETIQKVNDAFEGKPVILGFPTADGTVVNELNLFSSCSITAASQHKEGAWAFMEAYITAENPMDSMIYSFPTLKVRLEEKLESMQLEQRKQRIAYMLYNGENEWVQYEKDDEGNVILDENDKPVIKDITLYITEDFAYHAVRDEEAEQIMDILRTARPVSAANDKIAVIVKEEADYFFNGSKSAADVADIIQSRVRLYLSENQ